jgi:predicted RecA/RadA family phage recombinase
VIYNHLEKIWYYGSMNRTAWLDSPLRDFPMGAQSVQNSFLSSALTTTPTTNATLTLLNGYSYPNSGTLLIDSECISYTAHDINDGNTLTGCTRGVFNLAAGAATTVATHVPYSAVTYLTPNQVMFHENGTDDCSLVAKGEAIYSYVQSSDFDIGDGHNFGFVWRMLPDVTFDGSNVSAPKVNLSVLPRQNSGSRYGAPNAPAVISNNAYSSVPLVHNYVIQLFTGQVYTRIRGRQMAFKIESIDLGVAWQLGATRLDVRPDGRR